MLHRQTSKLIYRRRRQANSRFVVDDDDVLDVSGTASDPVVTPLPAPEPKPEPKPPATEHE